MPACRVCDEVVTQPLCAACLGAGIASWLQERLPTRPELLLQLEDLTDDCLADGETRCIKCRAPMGVCSACYLAHVHSWMARSSPAFAPELMAIFSLDPAFAHTEFEPPEPVKIT